jgi:tetratricopeptide (TPR) repeat protein
MKRVIYNWIKLLRHRKLQNSDIELQRARELWQTGPTDAVVRAFKKAIESNEKNHLIYFDLGNVYQDRRDHLNAICMFELALKIDPEFHQAYFTLGNAYIDIGNYDAAVEAYRRALLVSDNIFKENRDSLYFGEDANAGEKLPASGPKIIFDFKSFGLMNLDQLLHKSAISADGNARIARRLIYLQIYYNFPLLLIATRIILDFCKDKKIQRIELCSRDCNLWFKLFEKAASLMEINIDINYFFASRLIFYGPSETYLDYAKKRLTDGTLVIDLCGTGSSLAELVNRLNIERIDVFLIHMLDTKSEILGKEKKIKLQIHSIFNDEPFFDNRALEWANYAEHPSCKDIELSNCTYHPIFDNETRRSYELSLVRFQQMAFMKALDTLDKTVLEEIVSADIETLKKIAAKLYHEISASDALRIFEITFSLEEAKTLSIIQNLKNHQ